MATIQGGRTVNSLGNCLVPEIFGKQADCHFKQWPVSSDPGWKSKLLIYKSQHGGMPIITLFPGQFLYSEQWTPLQKLLPTVMLGLPWITSFRENVVKVFLSFMHTNEFNARRWVHLDWKQCGKYYLHGSVDCNVREYLKNYCIISWFFLVDIFGFGKCLESLSDSLTL